MPEKQKQKKAKRTPKKHKGGSSDELHKLIEMFLVVYKFRNGPVSIALIDEYVQNNLGKDIFSIRPIKSSQFSGLLDESFVGKNNYSKEITKLLVIFNDLLCIFLHLKFSSRSKPSLHIFIHLLVFGLIRLILYCYICLDDIKLN